MRSATCFKVVQRAVQAEIYSPSFEFELPELFKSESWDPLTEGDLWHSRERLEFLGDTLINSCIGLELQERFPGESPAFYSIVRSSLTSNATFTHLMVKMGAHTSVHPNRIKFKNKSTADAFETIIAAIHKERGIDVLRAWLKETFWPLLQVARTAYILYQRRDLQKVSKRKSVTIKPSNPQLVHWIERRKRRLFVNERRQSASAQPSPQHPPPFIIDLTLEGDDSNHNASVGTSQSTTPLRPRASFSLQTDVMTAFTPSKVFQSPRTPLRLRLKKPPPSLRSTHIFTSAFHKRIRRRLAKRPQSPLFPPSSLSAGPPTFNPSERAVEGTPLSATPGSFANPITID